MKKQEAFSELGLNENASEEDIKKAFKQAAIKYHPDRNLNNKEESEIKFKKINQAYQILTGKEKAEDDMREMFENYNSGMPFDINDIFTFFQQGFPNMNGDVFINTNDARGPKRHVKKQIQNINISTKLNFEESVLGCKKEIKYTRTIFCKKCSGTGSEFSNDICPNCKGSGVFSKRINVSQVIVRFERTQCNVCNGVGKIGKTCSDCNGTCGKKEDISLKVVIPAIGANITNLIIRGKGNVLDNIVSDCYLQIFPTEAGDGEFSNYYIENNDVVVNKKIKFDKLLLGGEVDIKLVNKTNDKIIVNELSSVGTKLAIKGQGVQSNIKGDLIIILDLELPKQLTKDKEQIETFKQNIEKIYQENNG